MIVTIYSYYRIVTNLFIIFLRGVFMGMVFDPLWETMKKKGFSQYRLKKEFNISPSVFERFKKNENVTTNTIAMFCRILDCEVSDIVKYVKD